MTSNTVRTILAFMPLNSNRPRELDHSIGNKVIFKIFPWKSRNIIHYNPYNPLNNFRAILWAILGQVVANQAIHPVHIDIWPTNFWWQESVTNSAKWVSFQFLYSFRVMGSWFFVVSNGTNLLRGPDTTMAARIKFLCLHFPSKFEWSPHWILSKFLAIPQLLGSQLRLMPPFFSQKSSDPPQAINNDRSCWEIPF